MFLHAGVVHFLFNMLGFLQVGALVERVFGWWRVSQPDPTKWHIRLFLFSPGSEAGGTLFLLLSRGGGFVESVFWLLAGDGYAGLRYNKAAVC